MKWIGQHIYDFISRFRNDVYLEDISTGTIASGGNLGLDSNNKIVKATDVSRLTQFTLTGDSGSNQTITQGGSVTLRLAGTATTGNRTLAQYGLCSLLAVGSNEFVISGAGLT